jgi:hypothetical protein
MGIVRLRQTWQNQSNKSAAMIEEQIRKSISETPLADTGCVGLFGSAFILRTEGVDSSDRIGRAHFSRQGYFFETSNKETVPGNLHRLTT